MNKRVALVISVCFHPVFINISAFYLLLHLFAYLDYALSETARWFYLIWIFVTTAIVPIGYVLVLKIFGRVNSIMLSSQEERRIPYLLTAVMYLVSFYFFRQLNAPMLISAFLLGSATIVIALLVINLFNKISIHMASFGMLAAVVVSAVNAGNVDVRLLLIPVLVFAGLTATARLYMEAHNVQQLLLGFIMGFVIMFFIL